MKFALKGLAMISRIRLLSLITITVSIIIILNNYLLYKFLPEVSDAERFSGLLSTGTLIFITLLIYIILSRTIDRPLRKIRSNLEKIKDEIGYQIPDASELDLETTLLLSERTVDRLSLLSERCRKQEKIINEFKSKLLYITRLEEQLRDLSHKVNELEFTNKALTFLNRELKETNSSLKNQVDILRKINIFENNISDLDLEEKIKYTLKFISETIEAQKGYIYIKSDHELKYIFTPGLGIEPAEEFPDQIHHLSEKIIEEDGHFTRMINSSYFTGLPLKLNNRTDGALIIETNQYLSEDEAKILTTFIDSAMTSIEYTLKMEMIETFFIKSMERLILNYHGKNGIYNHERIDRLKVIASIFGRFLNLSKKDIQSIERAIVLCDAGKLKIDNHILNKKGPLTEKEFSIIKMHPLISVELLGNSGILNDVRRIILHHHEHYNGSGYPQGISGEEIVRGARILKIIDAFDAMMSERPYRRSLTFDETLYELKRQSGKQFDPFIVESFLKLLNEKAPLFRTLGYNM